MFHEESHSQTFCNIHRKTPVRGLFFDEVAGHLACNFIKKRLKHRYFLANIGKFIRRPILINISERLHCWKMFCENVFQIRSEISKNNYWRLTVLKVAQISQDWIKMLPIIRYYARRLNSLKKRLNSYIRVKPQVLEKVWWKIGQNTENIFLQKFFCKISGNFNFKHLRWSKKDLSKETKKIF